MQHHYIALEDAREALLARSELRTQVEDAWPVFCGPFPFDVLSGNYFAVLARQLASFRFEDACFVLMSEQAGLSPAWLPYTADKFVTRSPLKRSYASPLMAKRYGRNGGLVSVYDRIVVSVNECSGKRLSEISTREGKRLVAWHEERLRRAYPSAHIFDEDVCNHIWGNLSSSERYDALLSLFIAHMVLFEDYHGGESGKSLDSFSETVFEPAFERVSRRFGVQPLIVALPWKKEFAYYPDEDLLANWRAAPMLSM